MPLFNLRKATNRRLLGLQCVEAKDSTSGYCMEISGGYASITSGKDAGSLEDLKLPAQRSVLVELGTVNPQKYNAMMEINPEIGAAAEVQFQRIYEPGELSKLDLHIRTKQSINLDDLDWIARIYMMD